MEDGPARELPVMVLTLPMDKESVMSKMSDIAAFRETTLDLIGGTPSSAVELQTHDPYKVILQTHGP